MYSCRSVYITRCFIRFKCEYARYATQVARWIAQLHHRVCLGFIRSEVERNPLTSKADFRTNMQILTASAKFIISKSSDHLYEKVCVLLLKSCTTAKLTTYEKV